MYVCMYIYIYIYTHTYIQIALHPLIWCFANLSDLSSQWPSSPEECSFHRHR